MRGELPFRAGARLEVSWFPVRAGRVLAKEAGAMASMVPSPVTPATIAMLNFLSALPALVGRFLNTCFSFCMETLEKIYPHR